MGRGPACRRQLRPADRLHLGRARVSKEEAAQCGGRGVGGSQLLQKSPQGIQEEGTRAGAAGQTGRRGLSLTHPPPTAEELPAEVSFALRSWLSGPRAPGGTSGERAQGLTPTPRTARSRGPESGVCVYAELAAATEVLALCLCPPHTQREAERETPGCAVFTHTRARARAAAHARTHTALHMYWHTQKHAHTHVVRGKQDPGCTLLCLCPFVHLVGLRTPWLPPTSGDGTLWLWGNQGTRTYLQTHMCVS